MTPLPTPEDQATTALNEQGFLFAQAIRDKLQSTVASGNQQKGKWIVLTQEYAVTASDGAQTRIDLVLRRVAANGHYACVECKRHNPRYRRWVFFDRNKGGGGLPADLHFESFRSQGFFLQDGLKASHAMERQNCGSVCPIFNLYLEVAANSAGKRASYTDTMEDAFLQVTRGQSGFMAKQVAFAKQSGGQMPHRVMAIPVVVTTAQLSEAVFDTKHASLELGTITSSNLKTAPLKFCAVSYHANDSIAVRSEFSIPCSSIDVDVLHCQTRTVFVVSSSAIVEFLEWLDLQITVP